MPAKELYSCQTEGEGLGLAKLPQGGGVPSESTWHDFATLLDSCIGRGGPRCRARGMTLCNTVDLVSAGTSLAVLQLPSVVLNAE
jgi:hypothetical protein